MRLGGVYPGWGLDATPEMGHSKNSLYRRPKAGVANAPVLGMIAGMKLSAYMKINSLRPKALARELGNASASGVIKWMRDERVPRPDQLRRIFEVTGGAVEPNDFILPAQTSEAAA